MEVGRGPSGPPSSVHSSGGEVGTEKGSSARKESNGREGRSGCRGRTKTCPGNYSTESLSGHLGTPDPEKRSSVYNPPLGKHWSFARRPVPRSILSRPHVCGTRHQSRPNRVVLVPSPTTVRHRAGELWLPLTVNVDMYRQLITRGRSLAYRKQRNRGRDKNDRWTFTRGRHSLGRTVELTGTRVLPLSPKTKVFDDLYGSSSSSLSVCHSRASLRPPVIPGSLGKPRRGGTSEVRGRPVSPRGRDCGRRARTSREGWPEGWGLPRRVWRQKVRPLERAESVGTLSPRRLRRPTTREDILSPCPTRTVPLGVTNRDLLSLGVVPFRPRGGGRRKKGKHLRTPKRNPFSRLTPLLGVELGQVPREVVVQDDHSLRVAVRDNETYHRADPPETQKETSLELTILFLDGESKAIRGPPRVLVTVRLLSPSLSYPERPSPVDQLLRVVPSHGPSSSLQTVSTTTLPALKREDGTSDGPLEFDYECD